ncbi:hypothetical protein P885DRAFT_79368 [Corynascus similis CBS 632.67]
MATPTYSREPQQSAVKPSPVRYLSEFAVADTPGTAGAEYANGGGGDYLQCRFVPINSQQQQQSSGHHRQSQNHQEGEGGMPSALGRGVRGGSGPVDERERRETRYSYDDDSNQAAIFKRENDNVDAGEGQMAMYAEGEVADAVERKAGTRQPKPPRRARRESLSVGSDYSIGSDGQDGADRRGSLPGLHGRGRGEVTLGVGEADLER